MKLDLSKTSHLVFAMAVVSAAGFITGQLRRTAEFEVPAERTIASTDTRFIQEATARRIASKAYPGGVHLSLSSDQVTPIQAGGEFTLTAQLISDLDQNGLHLRWKIKGDAELISGSENENLSVRAGEALSRSVSFKVKTDSNVLIVAEISRVERGPSGETAKRGMVAQFNTNPESLDPEVRGAPVHELQFSKPGRGKKVKIVQ
jgi:hypothetical protein